MLPPRKWLWSLGLLAAAPIAATAGPLDVFKPKSESAAAAPARDNQQVAEEIAGALRAARLVGRDIDIEFKNGVAVLSGQIADEAQKAAATRIVSSVEGVRSVENRMSVMAGAPRGFSESPIQQAAFEGDRRGPVQQIQYEAAGSTLGDQYAVASEPVLDSGSGLPEGAIMGGNQETAQRIAEAVQGTGLQNYDLEIRFTDGTCTLRGGVDTPSQAISAAEAAAKVPGVKTVLNQMTVQGRPVSIAQSGRTEPIAMYRPFPSAEAAQLAYQQQMQGGQLAQGQPYGGVQPVSGAMPGGPGMPMGGPGYGPMGPGGPGMGAPGGYPPPGPHQMYNRPNVPEYAWPAYAPYDNYAAVSYPSQYEASAWPYIGPFYPYPQVPAEWRSAQLVWDDGYWNLKFNSRTDKWWWFLSPDNWH